MYKIDRLLVKATSKSTLFDKLKKDNPYLGKSLNELLDYMGSSDSIQKNGSCKKDKFNYALIDAYCRRRKGQ